MVASSRDSGSFSARRGRIRIGLSQYQEIRLKRTLRASAPSEPWLEAQFITASDVDQSGRAILYRYHDARVFPPGGESTAMVRCPACGVFVPPNSIENGLCLDHARHDGWGPSPSAVAIRALQMMNLRIEAAELPPDDVASLRQEIEEHLAAENAHQSRKHRRHKD